MIKFFKKYKLNIIVSLFCSFAMALFTIISFSCKTYAYSIDNNGNLVGDNIISSNSSNISINNDFIYLNCDIIQNNTYTFSIQNGAKYGNYTLVLYSNNLPYQTLGSNISVNDNLTFTALYNGNSIRLTCDNIINNCNLMLNLGDNTIPWEPYGVWYSTSNYNTIVNQLNTTNGLLDLQIDITKYGWLSYIDNLEYYVTGNYVSTFTLNDLKTNNYISSNATLDLYTMSLYQNPNYSYIKFDIYFQNTYSNVDYFSANLFDISTKTGFNGVLTIYDIDSNSVVFNITDIMSITYEDIISQNNNFGDYIYNVTFEFASPDASTMIYTNSFYSRGYQTGYSYGSNVSTGYYTPIINDLNARISNLENDIVSLNNTIDTLKELNSQYQQQLADNVGWSSLFFAFADTPFKVVSNVLGFELFGLNLFATFIGMITVFGVVYLLKKFL